MSDFPDNEHVQGGIQNVRDLSRDEHPAARQTQDHIGLHTLVLQVLAQPPPSIFTRRKHPVSTSSRGAKKASSARGAARVPGIGNSYPVTRVPSFSPITTRFKLWER